MTVRALSTGVAAIWTATLAGALLALAGAPVIAGQAPRDALPANAATVIELLAHNIPVALWPLALVAIGWPKLVGARVLGDLLIAAQLLLHGLLVGSQLAQHPDSWRYLPHLPLEWLALAIPAGAWLHARRPDGQSRGAVALVPPLTGCLAALGAAAALETYLVPLA